MTSFADELRAASEDESLSPDELRAWMRLAALRLRNAEPATDAESQAFFDDARADAWRGEDTQAKGSSAAKRARPVDSH